MSDFKIIVDSACDLGVDELSKRGLICLSLTFRFADEEKEYSQFDISTSDFYAKMKSGAVAKTSAINTESFAEAFRGVLEGGSDILYLGFSSGLSTTYNSARLAMLEVKDEYPERKIILVDTLAASAGIALLADLVLEKKESGASIEETAEYAEQLKLKIAHWFTVDDLVYLKRGGRISPTLAFVGNLLGIKPVLHVDNEGHLVNVSKSRGRHASLVALAEKIGNTAEKDSKVYISHGNCLDDAKNLASIIEQKYGYKTQLITDVGPVIGAHSGPGTLALFFVASER